MDEITYEVWQDEMVVAATASSDPEEALKEARVYLAQYAQDGPVVLVEVRRKKLETLTAI